MKKKTKDLIESLNGEQKKIQALNQYSQQKCQKTEEIINKAIDKVIKLYRKGKIKRITVSLVAKEAGVTNATIYHHKDLLEKIKKASLLKIDSFNESKEIKETDRFKERIKSLISQIEEYKNANALLLGNLERKTMEVIELRERIKTLEELGNILRIKDRK